MATDITDVVKETKKGIQRKIRRIVCCAIIWLFLAIGFVVMGILLLAYYSSFWGDHDTDLAKAVAAYIGVATLILGVIMFVVAIILFIVFNNIIQINRRKKAFMAPVYPYGEAPYPQQKLPPPATVSSQVAPATVEDPEAAALPLDGYPPPPPPTNIPIPPPI